MPMSKEYSGSQKISVTELKMVLPNSIIKNQASRLVKKSPKNNENCARHINHHKLNSLSNSVQTVSIQNLNFPDNFTSKPCVKVPFVCSDMTLIKKNSKSSVKTKIRGYDFSSPTNSHFEGWVLDVPKKHCSSSTTSNISSSLKTSLPKKPPARDDTSQEVLDSQPKRLNFKGPEWQKPCKESFVAGAPRPYVGTCPYNFEKLSKMSKIRQKFFLTQDPRKKYCLRNPEVLRKRAYSKKKEFETLTDMIKHADNVCVGTKSEGSESFICEIIDLENPMALDFHGMDYKNTYEGDEVDIQNQRGYRRVLRHMDRIHVKEDMVAIVANEKQNERVTVPARFAVKDRNEYVESTPTEESICDGKLYRSADKPYNQQRIVSEQLRRHARYKDIYERKQAKFEQQQREKVEAQRLADEQFASALANKNFSDTVEKINNAIKNSYKKQRNYRTKEIKQSIYPHTMREVCQFKKEMKKEDRMKRDVAKVKQEFFKERCDKVKDYPDAKLEISSDTPQHSESIKLSEQSSDDEDDMEVGNMKGKEFKLRGFQYKLTENMRGKRHQNELQEGSRKEKGCISRDQWLKELAPKREHIKLDVVIGTDHILSPDDPKLILFMPQFNYKAPEIKESAVRQYVYKRLGQHYKRTLRKNIKFAKPRLLYTVKKFNLNRFQYSDDLKLLAVNKPEDIIPISLNTTHEFMEARAHLKKNKQQQVKNKRLQLLGLPCHEVKKSRLQKLCENSESESSDWVPDQEPDWNKSIEDDRINFPPLARTMRGNMPAPKFREATLRCHPRHPRDYFGERVESTQFDIAVKTTGIPYLKQLPDDIKQYANVELKKRPYTDKFNARHHHDHWNQVQKKLVDVHYQIDVAKPATTKVKTKADQILMENFRMANPPCNALVEMELAMPICNTDALIAEHLNKKKSSAAKADKERTKDICRPHDFIYHSRPREELENVDFPGRQEYLQFLQDIRAALGETNNTEEGPVKLVCDREAIIKELEEDLKSIESCLTSMSSSVCTNFTNDSGSFLLVNAKTKVPLDYIRKSLVPFEELQRSRFKFELIEVDAEDADPFKLMPFSGQRKAQHELIVPNDTFFTFNTRMKNGMRLRLEVPVEDVRKKLLQRGNKKFGSAVVTDIDEDYIEDLKTRPSIKHIAFKSGRSFIKSALRLKFESMLIQGQIVRKKIYDRLNEYHWETMQSVKVLYETLFAKWKKYEYEAVMSVIYEVKSYYETTDILKQEFRYLERELMLLNMDIVFIEGHWIQCLMLQNFHYLLGDHKWRYVNDWIHRKELQIPENMSFETLMVSMEVDLWGLENYEESIAKRSTVNIRKREKDDSWAIKAFYEEVYLPDRHPLLFVFPDSDSFLHGIENLKLMTFVLLLELHFTLAIHFELQGRLEAFQNWCQRDLKEKKEDVERKCAKKYFKEDRATKMKESMLIFLDAPIEMSFNNAVSNRDRAVIAEVWRELVPANIRGMSADELDSVDMVAMILDVFMELTGRFETVDMKKSRQVEAVMRRRRARDIKISQQTTLVEKRIVHEIVQLRKNLEPPFVKPKRKGKLPRVRIIKKKKLEIVPERRISEHTKFFFRAFHEEGDIMELNEARDTLLVEDKIQDQIVPFYFDHFLKQNGYTPNYNFKTNVELRDGQEIDRFLVREPIPEVLSRLEKWEAIRQQTMENNIMRNPKMYEDVQ